MHIKLSQNWSQTWSIRTKIIIPPEEVNTYDLEFAKDLLNSIYRKTWTIKTNLKVGLYFNKNYFFKYSQR